MKHPVYYIIWALQQQETVPKVSPLFDSRTEHTAQKQTHLLFRKITKKRCNHDSNLMSSVEVGVLYSDVSGGVSEGFCEQLGKRPTCFVVSYPYLLYLWYTCCGVNNGNDLKNINYCSQPRSYSL